MHLGEAKVAFKLPLSRGYPMYSFSFFWICTIWETISDGEVYFKTTLLLARTRTHNLSDATDLGLIILFVH